MYGAPFEPKKLFLICHILLQLVKFIKWDAKINRLVFQAYTVQYLDRFFRNDATILAKG